MKDKIVNQKVLHKTFGKGTIKEISDNLIKVSFNKEVKNFIFPDSFELYLKAEDENFQNYAKSLIREKKLQKEKEIISKKNTLPNIKPSIKSHDEDKVNKRKRKKIPRENIVFKCNFCDGGRTKENVGYISVCSDEVIYNNICIENKTWCSSEDSPCFQYFNNEITREELDSYCEDDGFVCYESQMLRDWKAYAGVVQTGERKGEPMKLQKVQHNSLCVLTTRNPQMIEDDRYIFAVFLVDETYVGDKQEEGYVATRSKYKIKLSPKQAEKMLFWKYYKNSKQPEKPKWGSGLHRYFDDEIAVQILRDIANIKKNTEDEALAREFLNYFCKTNEIEINKIKNPSGALTLI